MKISEHGIALIKQFEGCNLQAYKCPAGVWTIGYGHTGGVTKGQSITQTEANILLKKDLISYEKKVNCYSKYQWTQNEFDALVSFAYNVGNIYQLTGNGTRTKKEIAEHWTAYNKAGGKVMPGLTLRRQAELKLFLEEAEMVEESEMVVNGELVEVRRILYKGTNFIAIRDIAEKLGYDIGNNGNIAVLTKKE